MAHPRRFERPAFAFGGQRSIQLSYGCVGSQLRDPRDERKTGSGGLFHGALGPQTVQLVEEKVGQVFGPLQLLGGGHDGGNALGEIVLECFGLLGFVVHNASLLLRPLKMRLRGGLGEEWVISGLNCGRWLKRCRAYIFSENMVLRMGKSEHFGVQLQAVGGREGFARGVK